MPFAYSTERWPEILKENLIVIQLHFNATLMLGDTKRKNASECLRPTFRFPFETYPLCQQTARRPCKLLYCKRSLRDLPWSRLQRYGCHEFEMCPSLFKVVQFKTMKVDVLHSTDGYYARWTIRRNRRTSMGNICNQGITPTEITHVDEKDKDYVRRFTDHWSKKDIIFNDDVLAALRASFPNDLQQQTRFGEQILLGIIRREPEFLKLYKKMGTSTDPAILQRNSAFIAQAQRYVSTFKMAIFMAEKQTYMENQLIAIGKRHREHLPPDLAMHFWHSFYNAVIEVILEKVNENDALDPNEKMLFAKSWEGFVDYVVSVVAWAFYCVEPDLQSSRADKEKHSPKTAKTGTTKPEKKEATGYADQESRKHGSHEQKKHENKPHKEEKKHKAKRPH